MKHVMRAQQASLKLPNTQVITLLDEQLTIYLRPWGSQDYNQKMTDEISHYLSSAQAEIDITSPFDYLENLSSLANKTRIAILLAQDYFYKTENANEFNVGFEVCVFFQSKKELAWSSVGRFGLKKINAGIVTTLFETGTDLDDQSLLPVQLVGVEREIEIISGSLLVDKSSQYLLYSTYKSDIDVQMRGKDVVVEAKHPNSTLWYSLMKAD